MKKFFQKLKADYKFNKAGPGQKLSDNTRREPAQKPSQSQAGPSQRQSAASVKARNDAAQAAVDRAMKSKVCSENTELNFFFLTLNFLSDTLSKRRSNLTLLQVFSHFGIQEHF